MFDDLYRLGIQAIAWLETHPALLACFLGWSASLGAAQTVKLWLPATTHQDTVKRMTHLVAIAAGTPVAWAVWPATTGHSVVYSLVVGMSAPTVYTLLKALVRWKLPGLAEKLSWEHVQTRKIEKKAESDGKN